MDTGLTSKHILITGAAGGIGNVIMRLLIKEGTKLTLHFNNTDIDVEGLSEDELDRVYTIKANLTSENEINIMFEKAMNKFGRIDGLVCNAGIWPPEDILIKDMPLERWNHTLQVNLTGYFLCMKFFFKNIESNVDNEYASVVMIGSTAGVFGEANHADYSTSKAGLHGLMLTAKNEIIHLSRKGRVNIVSPGWTVTPMAKKSLGEDSTVTKVLQTIPLRKVALAKDIAGQVLALLSPTISGHVSGQNIVVAGGMEGRVIFNESEIDLNKKLG